MKKTSFFTPTAFMLSGLFSLHVLAQDADGVDEPASEEAPVKLEDLVVTAALEPLPANVVASSLTIITREDIEARQVKFVADLLRDVPGFNVSQSGGAGTQTQVRVRGAEANQILVLLDGVRANDPASSDEFQWQYALTSDVERIEIVRGPQSSIWGSDAVAGVVNIIRRKGSASRSLSARAELGSFGTTDLAADGAWSSDTLRLRAGVSHYDTDGISAAAVGTEKDGAENTTGSLGLEWDLTDALTLVASAQSVDTTSEFDDIDSAITGLPEDADRVTEGSQAYWQGDLRFAPAASAWSGNLGVSYSDTDNDNFSAGAFRSSTAAEVLELRARTSVSWGGKNAAAHRLTFALDHRETDFSARGATSQSADNQDQSMDVTGIAAEYVGQPFDGFSWSVSGRRDDNSDFGDIDTWQIAASHQVEEHVRVRGSYGTGSKSPTFTERYGFFPGFFLANPDLKPEESKGWELGVESDWLEGRLTLGAAYFDMVLENEINGNAFDIDSGLFTAVNRSEDSDRSGFELTLDARPVPGLTLAANYTYLDATEPGFSGDLRETRRPRHMASFNANWRFMDDRANLNLNLNYAGEQDDVLFRPPLFARETVTLGSYTVADVAGAYRLTEALELVFRVSNLTDEDYQEVLGYGRPGRAYYGGLRGRFSF